MYLGFKCCLIILPYNPFLPEAIPIYNISLFVLRVHTYKPVCLGIGNNTFELNKSYLRDRSLEIKYSQQELNSFMFGFYLGASKEFRLRKGLHLQLAYQHRYLRGFLSKDKIEYNFVDENLSGKVEAYNTLDRSFLMLGLKYYLAK
jgi:hypothetical protein